LLGLLASYLIEIQLVRDLFDRADSSRHVEKGVSNVVHHRHIFVCLISCIVPPCGLSVR
jgi:hypothetical protein